jgi:hypothetical protein
MPRTCGDQQTHWFALRGIQLAIFIVLLGELFRNAFQPIDQGEP